MTVEYNSSLCHLSGLAGCFPLYLFYFVDLSFRVMHLAKKYIPLRTYQSLNATFLALRCAKAKFLQRRLKRSTHEKFLHNTYLRSDTEDSKMFIDQNKYQPSCRYRGTPDKTATGSGTFNHLLDDLLIAYREL